MDRWELSLQRRRLHLQLSLIYRSGFVNLDPR